MAALNACTYDDNTISYTLSIICVLKTMHCFTMVMLVVMD